MSLVFTNHLCRLGQKTNLTNKKTRIDIDSNLMIFCICIPYHYHGVENIGEWKGDEDKDNWSWISMRVHLG